MEAKLEATFKPFTIEQVSEFQFKFSSYLFSDRDLFFGVKPALVTSEINASRLAHLYEEVGELGKALKNNDIVEVADALADIIYVAMGSFVVNGIPFNEVMWEVHNSNMTKIPGETARARYDAIKPSNWKAPNISAILTKYDNRNYAQTDNF